VRCPPLKIGHLLLVDGLHVVQACSLRAHAPTLVGDELRHLLLQGIPLLNKAGGDCGVVGLTESE